MRTIRKPRYGWLIAGLLLLAPCKTALTQKRLPTGTSTVPPINGSGTSLQTPNASDGLGLALPHNTADSSDSSVHRNLDALRSNLANAERQRALSHDTEQLLQMVAGLQAKMATNTSGLSHDEIRRQIDSVEKLAKNVKERMKGAR